MSAKTVSFTFPKYEAGMNLHQYSCILNEKRPNRSAVSLGVKQNPLNIRTYAVKQPFIMTSVEDNFWKETPIDLINAIITIYNTEHKDIFPLRIVLKIRLTPAADAEDVEQMVFTKGISDRVYNILDLKKVLISEFTSLRQFIKAHTNSIGIWNAEVELDVINETGVGESNYHFVH
uniref:ORF97 n=1 Tax=Malaco herpesvirus 1 TaxID=3031797 RepID=A0AA48P7U1_9VIRU|nr:TPA_asm: ORF97 [Malaco herpesvirus 1]